MATPESIAIRKAQAQERIAVAAAKLAKNAGVDVPNLAPTHKDLAIQVAVQLEAIADFLDSLTDGDKKMDNVNAPKTPDGEKVRPSDLAPETADSVPTDGSTADTGSADDAALAQAEATRLAEKQGVPADYAADGSSSKNKGR